MTSLDIGIGTVKEHHFDKPFFIRRMLFRFLPQQLYMNILQCKGVGKSFGRTSVRHAGNSVIQHESVLHFKLQLVLFF